MRSVARVPIVVIGIVFQIVLGIVGWPFLLGLVVEDFAVTQNESDGVFLLTILALFAWWAGIYWFIYGVLL